MHYAAGPWKLEPHQALIIEGKFPSDDECVFANVLLLNKFMQSLDYQHGRSQHFNRKQLKDYGKMEVIKWCCHMRILARSTTG